MISNVLHPQRSPRYKIAISKDSEKYYQRYRSHSLVGDEKLLEGLRHLQQESETTSTSGNNSEDCVFVEERLTESE